MKERPILFSGPMVEAILEGRKTQTRRVIRVEWLRCLDLDEPDDVVKALQQCPYGKPEDGDRLWVRETWGAIWPGDYPVPLRLCKIEYRADLPAGNTDYPGQWPAKEAQGYDEAPKWKPSIHMPRWASRLTLAITVVKVERLQDITLEDVKAEGIPGYSFARGAISDKPPDPRWKYIELWNRLNAKCGYSWDSNPWVWVIEFKKI
jgi:hypothetical protein